MVRKCGVYIYGRITGFIKDDTPHVANSYGAVRYQTTRISKRHKGGNKALRCAICTILNGGTIPQTLTHVFTLSAAPAIFASAGQVRCVDKYLSDGDLTRAMILLGKRTL